MQFTSPTRKRAREQTRASRNAGRGGRRAFKHPQQEGGPGPPGVSPVDFVKPTFLRGDSHTAPAVHTIKVYSVLVYSRDCAAST